MYTLTGVESELEINFFSTPLQESEKKKNAPLHPSYEMKFGEIKSK